DVTGYNKSYISQLIKQDLGINYYEYLTRVRMREAIFSLTNTTDRIADIALGNGFSDVKSFNSAFKERFGKSPSEYRKNLVHSQKQGSSHDKIYVEIEKYDEIIREWLKNEGSKEIQEDCDKSHSIEARNRIIAEVSEELRDLNERFENLELKFNKLK
ncbi:helix-turn-helix domain-containing protein, partial [Proteiniclasticum sp.]